MSEGYTSSVSLPSYAPSDVAADAIARRSAPSTAPLVVVNVGALRAALATVAKVIPSKASRPAIENVWLRVTCAALALTGTDLETFATVVLAHEGAEGAFSALVCPTALAAALAAHAPSSKVVLRDAAGGVDVYLPFNASGPSARIAAHDPDEYPRAPHVVDGDARREVLLCDLRAALDSVLPAVAKEHGRYAMHGAYLDTSEGAIYGTDGRRLHRAALPSFQPIPGNDYPRPIMPRASLRQLLALLPRATKANAAQRVALTFAAVTDGVGGYVHASLGALSVAMRCIDGQYPRVRAVIPCDPANVATLDTERLAGAFKRCAAVLERPTDAAEKRARKAGRRLGLWAVRMTFAGGVCTLTAKGESATVTESVPFEGAAEGDLTFNPDYVRDALAACGWVGVRLGWNDRTSPGRFDPTDGRGTLAVVMPITVDI